VQKCLCLGKQGNKEWGRFLCASIALYAAAEYEENQAETKELGNEGTDTESNFDVFFRQRLTKDERQSQNKSRKEREEGICCDRMEQEHMGSGKRAKNAYRSVGSDRRSALLAGPARIK